MAKSTAQQITEIVQGLRRQRQEHVDAIAEIDRTFKQMGIEADQTPARKQSSKKASGKSRGKRRKRKKFDQTAEQFVLDLLKNGEKLTTAEINVAWREAGRSGDASNTLTKLANAGQVDRENIEGSRGSVYRKAS